MPITVLSALARLSAGALLLQAGVPAALPIKASLDARAARDAIVAKVRARANRPPAPMKGVPTVFERRADPVPKPSAPRRTPEGPGISLLNEGATLRAGLTEARQKAWRVELAERPSAAREARLRIQLGEALVDRHEPAQAQPYFDRAAAILPVESPDRGLARFDAALSLYLQGRFGQARLAFRHLAASPLHGANRRRTTLMARAAAMCEGYHEAHGAMGIPEPTHLDPLCGVAALATCLRGLGMPYGEADTLRAVRHDGEGSSSVDLMDGLPRLGLMGRELGAGDKGLVALPKPLVAHVEHDHFVAVVAADAKGVEYVCSDCGAWPGGPVRLTWRQWHALSADRYLAVARPGTAQAVALQSLPTDGKSAGHVRLASTHVQNPGLISAAERILSAIGTSVVAQGGNITPHPATYCGMRMFCDQCTPDRNTPVVSCPGTSPFGSGDPVNVATAQEEFTAPGGLGVYNPTGPSVSWNLQYLSLANVAMTGFGAGWTHPYNYRIINGKRSSIQNPDGPPSPPRQTSYLVLPNSARIALVQDGMNPPDATTPVEHIPVPAGYPYLVDWCYDAASSGTYYVVTMRDRSRWTFASVGGGNFLCPVRIADRVGNFVSLAWSTFTYGTFDEVEAAGPNHGLVSISDSANQPLLTLNYAGGRVASVVDRYGRKVIYSVDTYAYDNVPSGYTQSCDDLNEISQVTMAGASSAPARAHYGYLNVSNQDGAEKVPVLNSISVPSPTGTGMSTATIVYSPLGEVTGSIDANGNQVAYTGGSGANTARVQFKTPSGTTVYQEEISYDSLMSETGRKNAYGQTTATYAYTDANDPFAVSAFTDGDGRTWRMTWDAVGNLKKVVSPKGTITTKTWDHSNFALGELAGVQQGAKTASAYTYYEPSGLVQYVETPIPGEAGTGNTQTTAYSYDAAGNVTHVVSPGNNAASSRSVYYGYTSDGAYSQAEALGRPITVTDALGKVWHRRYDARGELASEWDPLGNETDLDHNLAGQTVAEYAPATGTSGSGRAVEATTHLYVGGPAVEEDLYGESGSVVRSVAYAYGAEGETLSRAGSAETATITYDAAYRTRTLADGNGNATTYVYDLNGRTTSVAYPQGDGVALTAYDLAGKLLSRTDGNGQVTSYAYDDLDGELSAVHYPGAAANDVAIAYDDYGRVTSVTDGTGTATTAYDDLGNATSAARTYTGLPARTFTYGYWPDGSRQTLTTPAGTWGYRYDADGRYTDMVQAAGGGYSGASVLRDDAGRETARFLPDGAATYYGYDAAGDLASQSSGVPPNPAFEAWGSFGYDGAFNLTSLTASVPGSTALSGTTGYAYDAKDRLTGESSARLGGYSQAHAYDAAGNPTTLRGTSQAFDADNRLTNNSAYDGNGSPTTYRGTAATFDPEARMTAYGSASYGYRADGLRAWKQSGFTRTYFLYDRGEPVVEMDASGSVTAFSVYTPEGLTLRSTATGWTTYAFDPQGNVSTRRRHGASGVAVTHSGYDAYGNEGGDPVPADDPYGYNARDGYVTDRDTGLCYCQNRYYDPGAGRWLTRDPIGFDGGINLYGYCEGGPVGAADPSGLDPSKIAAAAMLTAMAAGDEGPAEQAADQALNDLGGVANEVVGPVCDASDNLINNLLGDLQKIIDEASENVGGEGRVAGTLKHAAANEASRSNPGLANQESTWLNGDPEVYGTKGAVRIDGTMNNGTDVVGVYDYKTGIAGLSDARIEQLLKHLPKGWGLDPGDFYPIRPGGILR